MGLCIVLITCDYLEIYLRGTFNPNPCENWQFVPLPGNRLYAECFTVHHRGVVFGVLLTRPRMETFAKDACHFKMANEQLYLQRTNSLLMEFLRATRLMFMSVTRLDIACDFYEFEGGLSVPAFVRKVTLGDYVRRGRAGAWNPHFVGSVLTGVSFGSRSSERHGRLYNKSLLLRTQNKPYISEWHRANGMTRLDQDIWRLEFTLRAKEVRRLVRPERLLRSGLPDAASPQKAAVHSERVLLSQDLLQGIFLTEMASYFTFCGVTASGNKSRSRALSLISAASLMGSPELIQRLSTVRAIPGNSYRYRVAVRTLLLDYYLTKDSGYLATALAFVRRYDLAKMAQKRLKYWLLDFAPWIDSNYQYIDVRECLQVLSETLA